MQKKRGPHYTEEFKQRAIELSLKNGTSQVAQELGVSKSSLSRWIAQSGLSEARLDREMSMREMKELLAKQQRRIIELERANKIAEMEREILKKATAFFARESK